VQCLKRLRLWFLYRSCLGIIVFSRGVFKVLPTSLFYRITGFLLRVIVFFILPRRRIVSNLNRTLGESYSSADKEGLAKGVQSHWARNIQDCLVQWLYPDHIRSSVNVKGIENLDAALSRGKGVIALGAHLGNFMLLGTKLGIEGYPFHTLIRFPDDRKVQDFIKRHVSSFYQTLIPSMPRRMAVERILGILKKNQIVFVLGDNFKRGRVPTHFFGQPVLSSRGPVSLALRSGAAVLPVYLIRNHQGGQDLWIEPEILITRNGHLPSDIVANTHRVTACLENMVRRYPDQWNWLTLRLKESGRES